MSHLTHAGVRLAYADEGAGDPPLVLIHGWSCDRRFLAPQAEHFRRQHRVVSPDLRGHGESDAPVQPYTIEGFTDDVVWLMARLGVGRAVLVGHSMGGVVALDLAARRPDLVAGLVLLDAPVAPIPRVHDRVGPYLATLDGPECRDVARAFVGRLLMLPTDSPERRDWILDEMARTPEHVLPSALKALYAYPTETALRRCRAPILLIWASRILSDLRVLRDLSPRLTTGQTVGAGHFHQLEVPEQVNAMIERWLQMEAPA